VGIFDRLDRLADQLGDLIVPDDVRVHVELGAAYFDRGELDAARRELELAVELRPDHERAAYLLGLVCARQADERGAIEHLSRAAARGRLAEPFIALGELHRRHGDTSAAVDAYRAALDAGITDPQLRADVYRGLGAAYLGDHRYDKAIRELRKAVASLPDDAEAQALLGRALFLSGDLDTARVCLERAARSDTAPLAALLALGELYQRTGRGVDARAILDRALARDADGLEGRLGMARLALERRAPGDLAEAHAHVLKALERAPGRPDILVLLGRVLAAAASPEAALDAFERALGPGGAEPGERLLFDRRGVLEEALALALTTGALARAEGYAAQLLSIAPDHPDARAALAEVRATAGALDEAAALAEAAAATRETVQTRLATAAVAERRGQQAVAAAALRRAAELDPRDSRPRDRLRALYHAEEVASPDLYALLTRAHRQLARTPELAELSVEAGRLVEVLDRPLLITVMGEFNAGKSTFVNALLGEEVAPMGITPTTATINILKYGAERAGRVVYLDDTARDVAWHDVPALLRGLRADEARRVRVVEVLYPLETLARVNVVDTPGLNSIHPEHEATARRFIGEADAVVWLFTVDQAAKATEGEALERIAGEGKQILGVLNKIDRCGPDELERIIAHVRSALGERLEAVVPFAARDALAARRAKDAAQLDRSNYPHLAEVLEERFFSRSRSIKREACAKRLEGLFERALTLGRERLPDKRLAQIEAGNEALREESRRISEEVLPRMRRHLIDATEQAYVACAREVLDFVRPRRWVFGSNEATPADRDFLRGLLEERLAGLLDESRERLAAEIAPLGQRVAPLVRAAEPGTVLRELDERVYAPFRAFARGYLRGGRIDDFFTRVLPKLELSDHALRRALERIAPWADDLLEAELRDPLRAWSARYLDQLGQAIERLRVAAELDRFDVEERILGPAERLRAQLHALKA
jgi:small GTP-binding protein